MICTMTTAPARYVMTVVTAVCCVAVLTGCASVEQALGAYFAPDPLTSHPISGATRSSAATPAAAGTIRVVHTPAVVVDDMHLADESCHARVVDAAAGLVLPDPACTPGGIDPAVTQANIQQTICATGYTKRVRPPVGQTDALKHRLLVAYGQAYERSTEEDHLISLGLGGSSSTSNLWVEPNKPGATATRNPKDDVEDALHQAVCSGRVTLEAAQHAIATDWTTAERTLGLTR
jgi:hypothetical protein